MCKFIDCALICSGTKKLPIAAVVYKRTANGVRMTAVDRYPWQDLSLDHFYPKL